MASGEATRAEDSTTAAMLVALIFHVYSLVQLSRVPRDVAICKRKQRLLEQKLSRDEFKQSEDGKLKRSARTSVRPHFSHVKAAGVALKDQDKHFDTHDLSTVAYDSAHFEYLVGANIWQYEQPSSKSPTATTSSRRWTTKK